MEIVLADPSATEALGSRLADACMAGTVIHLAGELGAGKTTLVRGLLRRLGYAGPVRSPTYTLVEPYEVGAHRIYHLDLYRLADPGELEYLGVRDLEAQAWCLVEWPERGSGYLPAPDLGVELDYAGEQRRARLWACSATGCECLGRLGGSLKPLAK